MEKFYNFNIYQIIEILLVLYNIIKNQNKILFYFNNYIN